LPDVCHLLVCKVQVIDIQTPHFHVILILILKQRVGYQEMFLTAIFQKIGLLLQNAHTLTQQLSALELAQQQTKS